LLALTRLCRNPLALVRRAAVLALCLIAATGAHALESNVWSRVETPTPGPPLAIGSAARGCLSGAATLPADGPGYEVIRLSRDRYYGLPATVSYVERLGLRSNAAGLPMLYIGDMAQPRGGPLPFGHASHQTGIDVDIWFTFANGQRLPPSARETVFLPSMLMPSWKAIDPKRFGPHQITLLQLAATDPRVDRIFVNPVIKATLCRILPERDHAWLGRLRPWWEHDDHFHVRLSCPADSPDCVRQAPVPPGDGCDAVLASWVRDQHPPPPNPPPPPQHKLPILPAACHAVLERP
jgi:penicillin-insensitive murein endopeptidase